MLFYGVIWDCTLMFSVCFFFQAEDGIRDLVRSRGLGDVYKRQLLFCSSNQLIKFDNMLKSVFLFLVILVSLNDYMPVSYTHLTLPTSDLV